ncbi:Trehalose utilization [Botrimarina colliarenosi]|uniref:Trehalose utilization n=1 Tax=Botrimarina colliarenosi TaxID=2528001 RepID=A0A5C6AM35_9BACT|nr:family 16 glycoside hydrolase [Botrimarina colliarenosi]TWU00537.1 Trehalose utilization [Botrimarina colliarenosi]
MTLPPCRKLSAVFALFCAATFIALGPTAFADGGWTDLTGGDDLATLWRGYQSDTPPASWSLTDGVLTLDGSGGDLVTRQKYADFELEFEFKIAPGGNSGVIYRAGESEPNTYETGPEYQVLDPKYSGVTPKVGPAALYDLYPAPLDASKPAGEWNTGRIVLRDGAVEHWINGQKVVSATIGSDEWNERVAGSKFAAWKKFATLTSGHIALQDHGSRVWYRNLRIKPLGVAVSANDSPKRMLFVTQSAGFKHSTVTRQPHELSHSEQVMQELGLRSGAFRVDCTQDVEADFTPELLKNYDVVAFFTTGELPIPVATREWFLNTWLAEQGHGFLGVHAGADTYADYEPYWDMIGGTFDGHPWTADTDVVLKTHADDHPAVKPWGPAGTRIALKEEIYQFKNWQPEKVRVLMSLDMERTGLKKPRHVPILWVKDYGKGRVVHMSLGHREDVWTNPTYQESLIGGVKWLLGVEPGDATPNPELSAAEQQLAEAAAEAE